MDMDLSQDVTSLVRELVDTPSVSGAERALADAVEAGLRAQPHLEVVRDGDTLVARTHLGRGERVVLAGHLDTVPENGNLPSRLDGDLLWGLGSCDMKGGLAVLLHLAATVPLPTRDVTFLAYECEEVSADRNGLKRLAQTRPDLLEADFAVLMEPTDGEVEGGCQGTLTVEVTARGARAHTARSWMGENAIHAMKPLLDLLTSYEPRRPVVDGITYREGLNAVFTRGGIARNVVPDECVISVNHRFAPDRDLASAEAHLRELFAGYEVAVVDASEAARPGLGHPAARSFVRSVTDVELDRAVELGRVRAKLGWTDVSLFSGLGVPAVNFGPGDPTLAHHKDEHVSLTSVAACEKRLRSWLTGD
ncbi:succinyl-diaminopimelate desuccinylase [Actinocorallia sp. API 0066]|uniref:succinyl-diaminopimelate desuccinylase n=1 Tax=Actinocorallia sp. API 0066 TaxID=2896846 RepID=UPI001E2AEC69|nr:succinyl-diaminopimelate desuccinylase [Actinocorallia sp. API 0066]MCD0448016.1 succinyl-diaminopimelate desuccinylase [Actinocorallia sp. API 0066]